MMFRISPDHPALPGHFPGHPVVPGVLLLGHVLQAVGTRVPGCRVTGIRKMKFLQPLLPGQACTVALATVSDGRLRFTCSRNGERIAEGNLLVCTEAAA